MRHVLAKCIIILSMLITAALLPAEEKELTVPKGGNLSSLLRDEEIPGQQIALWGYKLTFEHPITREKMTYHSMPEGNIWNVYADLLQVPEDTDEKREPDQILIRPEVVQKLEEFDKYKPIKTDELL